MVTALSLGLDKIQIVFQWHLNAGFWNPFWSQTNVLRQPVVEPKLESVLEALMCLSSQGRKCYLADMSCHAAELRAQI